MMVVLHLSPVFAVRQAELKGPYADKLDDISRDCVQSQENIFSFDKEYWAETILARENVENVRLSIKLPCSIMGEINRFEPAALVMTDRLYGLDRFCRLIPYDSTWDKIDLPLLIGLKINGLFRGPQDFRAVDVLSGLMEIKDKMPELYRQIAEIDFSDDVYVSIYLTTGTDRYLAGSRNFVAQLIKLDIVNRTVARSENGCYDLLYDGVVIKLK
jgi:hypothetical protein